MQNILKFKLSKRKSAKILIDTGVVLVAYILAFLIRFEFKPGLIDLDLFWRSLMIAVIICTVGLSVFRLYRNRWEYASIKDLLSLFIAVSLSWLVFVLILYFFHLSNVSRSVLVIFWMFEMLLLGGVRFSYRLFQELSIFPHHNEMRRVLVIGAGDAGEMIIRQMRNDNKLGLYPVVLIDDDLKKQDTKIHGVPVLGGLVQLNDIEENKKIDEIIIATPSASVMDMRRIISACERASIAFKTVPGPKEIMEGRFQLNQLRKVRLEDLLDRQPVKIEIEKLQEFIDGKEVLVTGAGGSIGSELSRQILRLKPKKIICLDRTENNLFYLEKELSLISSSDTFEVCIGDITNIDRCNKIFNRIRPDIVFHAAAYKHVPLMEQHPEEAIKNNVIGTMNMIMLSDKFNVEKFILISTDKAVKPTSIMGASKRIAEKVVRSYSEHTSTKLITVRFGNVLASYGSVVPLFQKQIERGGPVTITHPDMKRFFMTIPEAVKLIMESAKMGGNNEIFVLNMGEPLKLVDLARHLIKLSGFEPDKEIPIEFTGIRPGEKLYEELWNEHEYPESTRHSKILKAKGNSYKVWPELRIDIEELRKYSRNVNRPMIYKKLQELIPDYTPDISHFSELTEKIPSEVKRKQAKEAKFLEEVEK